MKRIGMIVLVVTLLTGLSTWAAFVPPSVDQVKLVAQNPATIGNLLKDATDQDAALVMIQTVDEMQKLGLDMEAVKANVAMLIQEGQKFLGDRAPAVFAIVFANVNPALLPATGAIGEVIAPSAVPASQPLAPPIEPIDQGQGTQPPGLKPKGGDEGGRPPIAPRYPGQ